MAHHTVKSGYSDLVSRINRFPQGAPPSETLYKILEMLFSQREAELVALLPIRPFTVNQAAKAWQQSPDEAQKTLDALADRAILVDIDKRGKTQYVLPPPMAGFFEFSMMRTRGDLDQATLAELFHQYTHIEEDFIRELLTRGETQFGRTFVHEPALSEVNALEVLDYERASEVIKTAHYRSVGMCYCRHKKEHLDGACDAPMDICMTFGNTARSLSNHGYSREIDETEALDLLQLAQEHNLVQFGENARHGVNFICNCCGCCCEAMTAARRFAVMNPIHTTNFIPVVDEAECDGCGKCVNVCPVEAMSLVSANDPKHPKLKRAKLDESVCLGCGLCVKACDKDHVHLESRPQRVITPLNGTHRTLMMAIERGTLQDLIFDNRVLWSHRALAALLGAILRLPPLKQAIASRQVKSRYLEHLLNRARA